MIFWNLTFVYFDQLWYGLVRMSSGLSRNNQTYLFFSRSSGGPEFFKLKGQMDRSSQRLKVCSTAKNFSNSKTAGLPLSFQCQMQNDKPQTFLLLKVTFG